MEIFMKAFLEYVCEITNQKYLFSCSPKLDSVSRFIIYYDNMYCKHYYKKIEGVIPKNKMNGSLWSFFGNTPFEKHFESYRFL